jgi:Family of unknown function (DUF6496)
MIGIVAAHDRIRSSRRKLMARKARKYSKKASGSVERAMKKRNAGRLKSGRSGRTVKSRKQAIAIGLSEARAAGQKVPKKTTGRRTAKKAKRKARG